MLAPIILYIFNRPWHTKQTVEAINKNELASERDLYIFADGPRTEAKEEKKNSKQVRIHIHTITRFRTITIEESAINKGLDTSIINGDTTQTQTYY